MVEKRRAVDGASHIGPFYFLKFMEFLDEKYQKLELPFLVRVFRSKFQNPILFQIIYEI